MRFLAFLLLTTLAAQAKGVRTPAAMAVLQRQATEAREQNRNQDALRLYRECVRLQPNWSEGWWYLGTLLYDQNAYAPARDALLKLVQLEPKSPPAAWALLGLCEFETTIKATLSTTGQVRIGNGLEVSRQTNSSSPRTCVLPATRRGPRPTTRLGSTWSRLCMGTAAQCHLNRAGRGRPS